jgi:hypothetical protein
MLLDQKSGNVKKYFKNAYDVKICDDGSHRRSLEQP